MRAKKGLKPWRHVFKSNGLTINKKTWIGEVPCVETNRDKLYVFTDGNRYYRRLIVSKNYNAYGRGFELILTQYLSNSKHKRNSYLDSAWNF